MHTKKGSKQPNPKEERDRDIRESKEERLQAEPTLSEMDADAQDLANRKATDAGQLSLSGEKANRASENGLLESQMRRRSAAKRKNDPQNKHDKSYRKINRLNLGGKNPVLHKAENTPFPTSIEMRRRVSISPTSSSGSSSDRKKKIGPSRPNLSN